MYDTIIIGAGISGMTAAIYAARKRMNFLFITDKIGGQFLESGEVLNYPGITKTTGFEFEKKMEEQLKFNKVSIKKETATKIKKSGNNFKVTTTKGEYDTRSIILTTGARPRELDVKGEKQYKNLGVTYCAICDGPLFAKKTVAVIGAGDSALEAADFLLKIAKKIYIINITNKFTAHEYLVERIKNQPNVEIITNARTKEVIGDGKFVTGLKYEQKSEEKQINVQGVFVEIGRLPNTEFLKNTLKLDKHNHIEIDHTTATSIGGIFAAGDCASSHEYQYTIAAGQGCMALLKSARYLAKKK